MLIGVLDPVERNIVLNPSKSETQPFKSPANFFKSYTRGVLMCKEQLFAKTIENAMSDSSMIDRIIMKLIVAEREFSVRRTHSSQRRQQESTLHGNINGNGNGNVNGNINGNENRAGMRMGMGMEMGMEMGMKMGMKMGM